nr:MAG TPA: holin [Caudoviricetes sp.]
MKTKWKNWLKAAGVRALKTIAQTAVATIGTSIALGDVNWAMVASASALAGVLSVLTSVAGLPEVTDDPERDDIN